MSLLATRGLGVDGTSLTNLAAYGLGATRVVVVPGDVDVTCTPLGKAIAAHFNVGGAAGMSVPDGAVVASERRVGVTITGETFMGAVSVSCSVVGGATGTVIKVDAATATLATVGDVAAALEAVGKSVAGSTAMSGLFATVTDTGDVTDV